LKKRIIFKPKPKPEESMISWEKGIIIGEFMINNYESFIELIKELIKKTTYGIEN